MGELLIDLLLVLLLFVVLYGVVISVDDVDGKMESVFLVKWRFEVWILVDELL